MPAGLSSGQMNPEHPRLAAPGIDPQGHPAHGQLPFQSAIARRDTQEKRLCIVNHPNGELPITIVELGTALPFAVISIGDNVADPPVAVHLGWRATRQADQQQQQAGFQSVGRTWLHLF